MKIKLQEYLKRHGYAKSNKHVKRLIRDHVVIVNGVQVKSSSLMVGEEKNTHLVQVFRRDASEVANTETCSNSSIEIDYSSSRSNTSFCIAFNKPCGMICTLAADSSSSCSSTNSSSLSLPQSHFETLRDIKPPIPENFKPVGRLDQHSHGLLLFSLDGRLTSALLSPATCVERTYRIIVQGDVGAEGSEQYAGICNSVAKGVETSYGTFEGKILSMERDVYEDGGYAHAQCGIAGGKRYDQFDERGEKQEHDKNQNIIKSSIIVSVKEGKKRMVRRLFAAIGFFVLDLERIKYGEIEIGNLSEGDWIHLTDKDLIYCKTIVQSWEKNGSAWDR